VLGCYYLTKSKRGAKGEGRAFGNPTTCAGARSGRARDADADPLRYTAS
jgi:hypothetical protein